MLEEVRLGRVLDRVPKLNRTLPNLRLVTVDRWNGWRHRSIDDLVCAFVGFKLQSLNNYSATGGQSYAIRPKKIPNVPPRSEINLNVCKVIIF